MKLSEYYQIINPVYHYYKVTPLKSLRNYNTDKLISVFATLSENIRVKVYKEDKKLIIKRQSKFAYYIYVEKNNVEFYFIVPNYYERLLIEKIKNAWKGVTIDKVDNIPMFQGYTYALQYDKNYCCSLATDKRNNTLLQGIINVKEILENGDKLCIFYNFMTCSQKYVKADHDNMTKKYNNGYTLKNSAKNIFRSVFEYIYNVLFQTLGAKQEKYKNYIEPLSPDTLRKRDSRVIDTQVIITSTNKTAAIACCEAYKCISQDNEMTYKKCKDVDNYSQYYLPAPKNRMSCRECQNFVSLPAKEIIEEYNIKCINTFETQSPKELTTGYIRIGKNIYRGTETEIFMCNDSELRNLPLCLTGSNRSGKTTYLENITADCLKANECVIAFDFCGRCEFTERLNKTFKNTLVIDCSDSSKLQGLGYNEISKSDDVFKQYRNAKMQSIQLSTLINACNEEDKNLKAKMDRYLEAASLVVFISNGSIKDVFGILQDHIKRKKYIDMIPKNQVNNLEEYVTFLKELDEVDKKTNEVIGTVYRKVEGIIDRLNALKRNTYIELMLKKDCTNNFNLLNEIQKNQLICIKMPESMFSTHQEKDIFCTYWFSKLWLALQLRKNDIDTKNHMKVNILIDELYQVEHCQALVSQKLSQMPKFTAKLIVSCHYLNQIQQLREELKACNSTYMLLQGSNVSNFDSLKLEFNNLNYNVDDLLNLKRYNSLNLVSYEKGYWAGITQLPKPL